MYNDEDFEKEESMEHLLVLCDRVIFQANILVTCCKFYRIEELRQVDPSPDLVAAHMNEVARLIVMVCVERELAKVGSKVAECCWKATELVQTINTSNDPNILTQSTYELERRVVALESEVEKRRQ